MCPPTCSEYCLVSGIHWPAPNASLTHAVLVASIVVTGALALLGLRSTWRALTGRRYAQWLGATRSAGPLDFARAIWFFAAASAAGLAIHAAWFAELALHPALFRRCGSSGWELNYVHAITALLGATAPYAAYRLGLRRLAKHPVVWALASSPDYRASPLRNFELAAPSRATRLVVYIIEMRTAIAVAFAIQLALFPGPLYLPATKDVFWLAALTLAVLALHYPRRRALLAPLEARVDEARRHDESRGLVEEAEGAA